MSLQSNRPPPEPERTEALREEVAAGPRGAADAAGRAIAPMMVAVFGIVAAVAAIVLLWWLLR